MLRQLRPIEGLMQPNNPTGPKANNTSPVGRHRRQPFHNFPPGAVIAASADLAPRLSMADDRAAAGGDPSPRASPLSSLAPSNPLVDASSFTHTLFYCEENVYLLCMELIRTGVADPGGDDLYVVFISNERKQVPLWHQKASRSDDGFICWDYHVICIQARRSNREIFDLVWDLDSDLPFPSTFSQYVSNAIRPLSFGDSVYRRLFRVIHAPMFLRLFASDRSHMKDANGNWLQLPPKYEPIVAEDGTTNNLNEYIAMSMDDVMDLESMVNDVYFNKHGVVVNEMVLPKFFSWLPGGHP